MFCVAQTVHNPSITREDCKKNQKKKTAVNRFRVAKRSTVQRVTMPEHKADLVSDAQSPYLFGQIARPPCW